MTKNKAVLLFIAIFFLHCNFVHKAFCTEAKNLNAKYPDYSYEFTGKDKFERFNRKLFIFNLKLNKYVLKPVNTVWASVMPKYGMDRLQSAYCNINYPIRVVGCLLQKDVKAAKQETLRFLTNTTLGIGGLYDPALKKFKLAARQEDMGQVLAHYNLKKGPYLVLPVVQGNLRELAGKLLDCPLRPTTYAGPFGLAANTLFTVNGTTYWQPMIKKVDETYADPYEIAKQADGITRYIKILNLDRQEVFLEKIKNQNITNIGIQDKKENLETPLNMTEEKQPMADIELKNYTPQSSLVDSMRTAFFDNQKLGNSIWAEISLWNKTFGKQLKTDSVLVNQNRKKYKYRYILQKNKTSPLAIIYPSIGEGIMSEKSIAMAKILYENGYSVLIQGSAFQWEFIKSMPENYRPGLPNKDAEMLRFTTAKIIEDLKIKKNYTFDKKILIGCSFGALTGLFTAEQEEAAAFAGEKTIGISKFIAINPPIKIFYALDKLDKYCQDWKNDSTDIKLKTAIAAEKIIQVAEKISQKELKDMPESMPFTDDEAKLVITFVMKQKLSDLIFTIENCSRAKKTDIYSTINNMSFYDYANKYLFSKQNKTNTEFDYESSLYSISDFLKDNQNYKIYHTLDDYFVNNEQLNWLKDTCEKKALLFSNGSHLGFLYRKEFIEEFKKDIDLSEKKETGL